MPTYEYKCTSCGKDFEYTHSMTADPMSVCEACGGKLERLISRSAFQLKGRGWYKDGYGSRKPGDRAEPLPPDMPRGMQQPVVEAAKPASTPSAPGSDAGSTGGGSSGGDSSGGGSSGGSTPAAGA
jgi:putative FmdB family regulatory protein